MSFLPRRTPDDQLTRELMARQSWEHVRSDIDVPVTLLSVVGVRSVTFWLGVLLPEDRIEIKTEAELFLPGASADPDDETLKMGVWEIVEQFQIEYTKPNPRDSHLLTVNGNRLGTLRMITVQTDPGPWRSRITVTHKQGSPKSIPYLIHG